MSELPVSLQDIKAAAARIAPYVKHTPLLRAEKLDAVLGCKVYLKPENLQVTGSFKIRGASNKVLSLSDEERARGIIASSSGNHAQGVSFIAQQFGVRATVVMPENAPHTKVEGCRAMGAEVVLYGNDSIQRYKKLYEIRDAKGYTMVHSYDDPALIAGQGTSGLEIAQDLPDVDAVVVPLGGGGLLAGVATAIKGMVPGARVIGVEPAAIPRYSESFRQGERVVVPMGDTIADGLMITMTGENTYPLIKTYVDEVVTAEDEFIKRALGSILFGAKVLPEPSAAVGVAAAMARTITFKADDKVCFFISGGNIDSDRLASLIV